MAIAFLVAWNLGHDGRKRRERLRIQRRKEGGHADPAARNVAAILREPALLLERHVGQNEIRPIQRWAARRSTLRAWAAPHAPVSRISSDEARSGAFQPSSVRPLKRLWRPEPSSAPVAILPVMTIRIRTEHRTRMACSCWLSRRDERVYFPFVAGRTRSCRHGRVGRSGESARTRDAPGSSIIVRTGSIPEFLRGPCPGRRPVPSSHPVPCSGHERPGCCGPREPYCRCRHECGKWEPRPGPAAADGRSGCARKMLLELLRCHAVGRRGLFQAGPTAKVTDRVDSGDSADLLRVLCRPVVHHQPAAALGQQACLGGKLTLVRRIVVELAVRCPPGRIAAGIAHVNASHRNTVIEKLLKEPVERMVRVKPNNRRCVPDPGCRLAIGGRLGRVEG